VRSPTAPASAPRLLVVGEGAAPAAASDDAELERLRTAAERVEAATRSGGHAPALVEALAALRKLGARTPRATLALARARLEHAVSLAAVRQRDAATALKWGEEAQLTLLSADPPDRATAFRYAKERSDEFILHCDPTSARRIRGLVGAIYDVRTAEGQRRVAEVELSAFPTESATADALDGIEAELARAEREGDVALRVEATRVLRRLASRLDDELRLRRAEESVVALRARPSQVEASAIARLALDVGWSLAVDGRLELLGRWHQPLGLTTRGIVKPTVKLPQVATQGPAPSCEPPRFGPSDPSGNVAVASRAVSALRPLLKACYVRELKRSPTLEVVAYGRIHLGPDGVAEWAMTASTKPVSAEFAGCLADSLVSLRAGVTSYGATIDVPITFVKESPARTSPAPRPTRRL
jgi:hypothetical protein